MATKFIISSVSSIQKSSAGETLRRMGEHCVKQAYAGNMEDTQYAVDNLPKWAQGAFVSWLRGRGIDVLNPVAGKANFLVVGVKDQKQQAKALESAKVTPVLKTEHTIKTEKAKTLKGAAGERVQSAIERLIAKMKKDGDTEAAALLNDTWCAKRDAEIATLMASEITGMRLAA